MTKPWMQYGRVAYDIGSQDASGVRPSDIVNSLARLGRFTGHLAKYQANIYSVARHSVFVSELLDIDTKLSMYGLLHDLHETVLNDWNSPVKQYLRERLGPDGQKIIQEVEDAADSALYPILGMEWPVPAEYVELIKRADWVAAATEKRDLLPECSREWGMLKFPATGHKWVETGTIEEDVKLFKDRWEKLANGLNLEVAWA